MFLRVGNKVSVNQLLDGLITDSGNDAAVQLAQYIGGSTSTFIGYMNRYLKQLGLKNSHFSDVDGLPIKNHYMSAKDMAQLMADITKNFPKLYHRYFSIKHFTWDGIKQYNRCSLLWSDPGWTEARPIIPRKPAIISWRRGTAMGCDWLRP